MILGSWSTAKGFYSFFLGWLVHKPQNNPIGSNLSEKRYRIAIVVQRYGENVSGGAELHARQTAEHLLEIADVDVFTTCATDYLSWRNEFPAGTTRINGVRVNRFPVERERTVPSRVSEFELFQKSYALDFQYNNWLSFDYWLLHSDNGWALWSLEVMSNQIIVHICWGL